MTIEDDLKSLISIYSKKTLDKKTLLQLDADFIKVINQQLLANGASTDNIKTNYKKLTPFFHPDHHTFFTKEVQWLNEKLSESNDSGLCFKTLHSCYEILTDPQKYKEIEFGEIKSKEDFRKWLEIRKNKAGTYTGRSFCTSLIALFDQSALFFDEAGKIKPVGLRALVSFIPMIFSVYGAFILAEELLAVYAVYFVLLKSGKYLERSDSEKLQKLGQSLKDISFSSALTTATLIARLLEMTFWASNQCLYLGLEVGTAILNPFLSSPVKRQTTPEPATPYSPENLRRDLVLASETKMKGVQFQTPELQVVAAPLQAYIKSSKKQYLRMYRAGQAKSVMAQSAIFMMEIIDKQPIPLLEKLNKTYEVLEEHKKNSAVYVQGSKTANAVDHAEQVITLLIDQENQAVPLITYNAP